MVFNVYQNAGNMLCFFLLCVLWSLVRLDSLKTQTRPNLIELLTTYEVKRGENTLNNFLSELETRYSIARETVSKIGSRVASDCTDDISNEAQLVQKLVTNQLMGIEGAIATDILFYNEPLFLLEDTAQSFSLSGNTFDFCMNSNIRSEVMQKKFTQSNIKEVLAMNSHGAINLGSDETDRVNRNIDGINSRMTPRRGNILPSLQRLQKESEAPPASKMPSNVDSVLDLVERRKKERIDKAIQLKQKREFEKVMNGMKEELRQLTNINDSSSLLDTVTSKVGEVNTYTKKVINNMIIDNIASNFISSSDGSNAAKGTFSNISVDEIQTARKSSFHQTFRGIERIFIDPALGNIIGGKIERRIQRHIERCCASRRTNSLDLIHSAVKFDNSSVPNFPLLLHSCLLSSMAAYNLELNESSKFKELIEKITGELWANSGDNSWEDASIDLDKCRAASMAAMALGLNCFKSHDNFVDDSAQNTTNTDATRKDETRVFSIRSSIACAILSIDYKKKMAILAFRGTRDPVDVVTDLKVSSVDFTPRRDVEGGLTLGKMEVHRGFLSAFESLSVEINEILDTLGGDLRLVITGHSMGGGLSQIAAAYYSYLSPILVTFGSPSVGNSEFCAFVNRQVSPAGGIRVFNEYDPVVYLAQIVGYSHAGTPICLKQRESAKEIFINENINTFVAPITRSVVTPHILYQVGNLVHTFPILGHSDSEDYYEYE